MNAVHLEKLAASWTKESRLFPSEVVSRLAHHPRDERDPVTKNRNTENMA